MSAPFERPLVPRSVSSSGGPAVRTWQLFALLAAGHLGVLLVLNGNVMTDEVYLSLLPTQLSSSEADAHLRSIRNWEILGYLLSPIGLFLRMAIVALLVQLALLAFFVNPPFVQVFRAGLWAETASLAGAAIHSAWMATLPAATIAAGNLGAMPGSLATLRPSSSGSDGSFDLLLQQITVFDVGWCLLFILALEDGLRIRAWGAAVAVPAVWLGMTLLKWGMALFLTGLG